MTVYDLVRVQFDTEVMYARPIDFILDKDGAPIQVAKIATTCPFCSSLNELDVSDVIIDNDTLINMRCQQCERGTTDIELFNSMDASQGAMPMDSIIVDPLAVQEPVFIDPIEQGLFKIEDI